MRNGKSTFGCPRGGTKNKIAFALNNKRVGGGGGGVPYPHASELTSRSVNSCTAGTSCHLLCSCSALLPSMLSYARPPRPSLLLSPGATSVAVGLDPLNEKLEAVLGATVPSALSLFVEVAVVAPLFLGDAQRVLRVWSLVLATCRVVCQVCRGNKAGEDRGDDNRKDVSTFIQSRQYVCLAAENIGIKPLR